MTKGSTKKQRKVKFDLSESDYDSDSSENSENNNRKSKARYKKLSTPLKKFEPPPLDASIKLKSILKNKKACVYKEPALTTSLLPLHIINSVINAKFGPLIEDLEDSDSGSDESDTLSNDLYLRTKGNLDVEYNNIRITSRQNSTEGQSRDEWLLSFKDEDSEEIPFINDSKESSKDQALIFQNSLNSLIDSEILNTNTETPLTTDRNLASSSDTSESSENSEKPKSKKPRRKLKVSINNPDNSGDTDSEETFEFEFTNSEASNLNLNPNTDLIPKPNLLFFNAHEISYLGYYCDENFDSILTIPETLTLSSCSDYNNALIRLPPVILESVQEKSETPEYLLLEPEIESNHSEKLLHIIEYDDNENIKNSFDFEQNNSTKEQIFIESTNKEQFNSNLFNNSDSCPHVDDVLEPLLLEFSIRKATHCTADTLPTESNITPTTESHLTSTTESHLTPTTPTEELPQQTSGSKRTSRGHHKSHKKRVFLAVRLPCDAEEQPLSPTKRNIKPYTKKPRKPIKVTMDFSGSVNCAGEPEVLTPNQRDDIKEKDILIWIYNMIDEPARIDYEFFLKDGCILCKLMNRIKPDSIPEEEITWEGTKSKQKNIRNFLTHAEQYGVPKAKLFYPEDLLHLRHVPRVTRCIYALAKLAQDDPALGPDCPQLGDEPSFVAAAKKVEIPGHRDTKEVLSQIASSMQKKDEKKATKRSLYQ